MFKKQIETLRSEMKDILDKKNNELYSIKSENEERVREIESQKARTLEEMR